MSALQKKGRSVANVLFAVVMFFPFRYEFHLFQVGKLLGSCVIACCRTAEQDKDLYSEKNKKK